MLVLNTSQIMMSICECLKISKHREVRVGTSESLSSKEVT